MGLWDLRMRLEPICWSVELLEMSRPQRRNASEQRQSQIISQFPKPQHVVKAAEQNGCFTLNMVEAQQKELPDLKASCAQNQVSSLQQPVWSALQGPGAMTSALVDSCLVKLFHQVLLPQLPDTHMYAGISDIYMLPVAETQLQMDKDP